VRFHFPVSSRGFFQLCAAAAMGFGWASPLAAQSTAFSRALAAAAAQDDGLAGFYQARGYAPLWTSAKDGDRRQALLRAIAQARAQGLPSVRYDAASLILAAQTAQTEGDLGRLEVAFSAAFLSYATDLNSGALTPKKIDAGILREIKRPKPADLLQALAAAERPYSYLRSLAPKAPQYARLVKEKLRLETEGQIEITLAPTKIKPGDSGSAVIALRNRLVQLNYLDRSALAVYDGQIRRAVQKFQLDQRITADGVAGATTIAALNETAQARLAAITVALERMRWMANTPLGARHIWVNQPSFVAEIVDNGRVSFETRVVIGKATTDTESPEFSDLMEYMVVNPSWGVPRSIIVKEYLPLLQSNPEAVGHLQVIDGKGRVISRDAVDFAGYTAASFPYGLRQPPSDGNALGKVKFMFPNPYNIYLHDTPAKSLFANEVRAYSHGCIRLGDPFDFAYTLLAKQSRDPKAEFAAHLATKQESNVTLIDPVPVHLVYYTAWPTASGSIGYHPDIYGRDAALFKALQQAGVVVGGVQG
jgi:L,D-transpeptidase YcbB